MGINNNCARIPVISCTWRRQAGTHRFASENTFGHRTSVWLHDRWVLFIIHKYALLIYHLSYPSVLLPPVFPCHSLSIERFLSVFRISRCVFAHHSLILPCRLTPLQTNADSFSLSRISYIVRHNVADCVRERLPRGARNANARPPILRQLKKEKMERSQRNTSGDPGSALGHYI